MQNLLETKEEEFRNRLLHIWASYIKIIHFTAVFHIRFSIMVYCLVVIFGAGLVEFMGQNAWKYNDEITQVCT